MDILLWDDLCSTHKVLFPDLIGRGLLSCSKSEEQEESLEI